MSGGKGNRKQRAWLRQRNRPKLSSKCPKCGGEGPHFIPPSFGDPGFFMCDPSPHTKHEWDYQINYKVCTVCGTSYMIPVGEVSP